jgi:hypothetical protein
MPRVDDCISLLLGGAARHSGISAGRGSYFVTAGWLRGERSIYSEYEYAVGKYGEETGKRIMSAMLANYHDLALLDTGSFDLGMAKSESEMIAAKLGLRLRVLPASVEYIVELLTGPYPNGRFCTFPPNTRL